MQIIVDHNQRQHKLVSGLCVECPWPSQYSGLIKIDSLGWIEKMGKYGANWLIEY